MMTQAQALQRAAQHFRAYEKGAMGDDSFTELAELCEEVVASRPYQVRVGEWMLACFNPEIADDHVERGDRLLEETFELLQTMNYDFDRIAVVRDYVASRPVGEQRQEVGGVAVCLFALCNAIGVDVGAAAEAELERICQPEMMVKIRAKQAAKPKMSPAPQ